MIHVRPFDENVPLGPLVDGLFGPDVAGWALVFTRTKGSLCRLAELDLDTIDEMIWAHLFSAEVELRWREDARAKRGVLLGDRTDRWPDADHPDLELDRGDDIDLPLIGHFEAGRWGQGALRPGALDYPTIEVAGRPLADHDQLALRVTPLVDHAGELFYHWHRDVGFWEVNR